MCLWCRSSLSQRLLRTPYCHPRSSASAICSDWHSTGSTRPDCDWTLKFRSRRTSHMDPSATSTKVTGTVGERLQTGTEDAPVLDHSAPIRRFRDSGAGYKYPDLLTYLLTTVPRNQPQCSSDPGATKQVRRNGSSQGRTDLSEKRFFSLTFVHLVFISDVTRHSTVLCCTQ